MGTYTQIAGLANKQARGGRHRKMAPPPKNDGDRSDEGLYRCPECDDTSVVACVCDRCGISMSRRGAHRLGEREALRRASKLRRAFAILIGSFVGAPGAAGVVALMMQADDPVNINLHDSYFTTPENALWVLAAGALAIFVVLASTAIGARSARWLDKRMRLGGSWQSTDVAELTQAPAPVRTRARVHVEEGHERTVYLSAEGVRVRLPRAAKLRVLDEQGEHGVLVDGDRVEVVGTARLERGRGAAYRDAEPEVVLEKARLWVER